MFNKSWFLLLIIVPIIAMVSCKQNGSKNAEIPTSQTHPQADPIYYYLSLDTIVDFSTDTLDKTTASIPYAEDLVVAPGVYNINGKVLDLKNEGLYRVLIPFEKNYQIIVFKDNAIKLLSSISWMVTHGNSDDNLSEDSLISKARHDKLYITCEKNCVFTKSLLARYGIKARFVQGLAIGKPNGYDEGHVMLEVLIPQTKQWMLVDIDNNAIFKTTNGTKFLNLVEFKDALTGDSLVSVRLSLDKRIDISQYKAGNYSFGFFGEGTTATPATINKWYKRILEVVLIDNYYYNAADTTFVKNYYHQATLISKDSFQRKFYNYTSQ